LRALTGKATTAHRWRRALPTLLAGLPTLPDLPPESEATPPAAPVPAETSRTREWLRSQATELAPEEAAQWHLLRVRAETLEAEAAALSTLLMPRT